MKSIKLLALSSTLLAAANLGSFSQIALATAVPVTTNNHAVMSLSPMLKTIMPAIVNIAAKTRPSLAHPRADQGFGSVGSGVIIDANKGYIVTNAHVVDGADSITVTLQDGRATLGKQIGVDKDSDIALIQVDLKNLHAAPLADSSKIEVGDFVAAIGSPYGLTQTVTSGIISATQRSGLGIEGYEDFIQTDAPINPGNSGGALVNMQGEVVGINTAILGPEGGSVGIGFAIPSSMVENVVKQLIQYGKVDRGIMGVLVQSLTPALNEAIGIEENTEGAIVSHLLPASPAAKAGFQIGDVILTINNKKVRSASDVRNIVGFIRTGSNVEFEIWREGKEISLTAITETQEAYEKQQDTANPFLAGVSFIDITAQSPAHGYVTGVKVLSVSPDSKAWTSGLRPNDVIISVNKKSVKSVSELDKAVQTQQKTLLLNVLRASGALFIVVK